MGSCTSSPDEPEPDILEFYQEAEQVGESQHIVKNSKVVVRRKRDRYLSINNYAVLRLLGEGRYGEVYLCRSALPGARGFCACMSTQDEEDDESTTFAIKLVRRQLVTKEEFNILLKVQHPNIVALLEYIDDPTYPYVFLVFENCGGGPIAGCTNDGFLESEDGPWSEEKSSPLFLQLVSALAHLHSMGVFHRDIKPENVVFTSSRHTVKLIDFGESRMLRRKGLGDDSSRSTKGTPFFMASEMLSGLKFLNKEADVWALGVLLYLLTVGKVPFGCRTTNEIQLYNSIQHDELVFPPSMSLLLQDMLRGMLNRDLSKRSTLPFLMHHPWVRETPTASPTARTLCTNPTLRSFDRESDGRKLDESGSRADNPLVKPKRSPYFRALGASCLSSGPMLDNEERSLSSADPGICKTPVESCDRMMPDTPLGGILGISVRKKKMMIVDDQRKVIEHLRQLLAKAKQNEWKLDLSWAITAEGGLDEVLKESEQGRPYDVVIMDTYPYSRESKMTGVDALRRLREIEEERGLEATLAVLSTTEEECPADLVDVAKELNVDVVHKPFTPVFVYELLRELGLRATSINNEDCLANIPEEDYAGRQYMVNATQRSEGRYTTRGNDTQSCPNTIDVPDDLFTTQCSCSTPSTPKSLSSLGGQHTFELSSYSHYRQTLEWTTTKSETASHSLASSRHVMSPL